MIDELACKVRKVILCTLLLRKSLLVIITLENNLILEKDKDYLKKCLFNYFSGIRL